MIPLESTRGRPEPSHGPGGLAQPRPQADLIDEPGSHHRPVVPTVGRAIDDAIVRIPAEPALAATTEGRLHHAVEVRPPVSIPAGRRDLAAEAEGWRAHEPALAGWARRQMINIWYAHGHYKPLDRRIVNPKTGRLDGAFTSKDPLDLARHFRGEDVGHLIGLHTLGTDEDGIGCVCRWVALDFDNHRLTPEAPDLAGPNLAMALACRDKAAALGLTTLLLDSDGRGGLHLVLPFERPAPATTARRLVKWLAADFATHGLPGSPDLFPSNDRPGRGGLGSWLRLPGRHHTLDHWTRVWDDGRGWLAGPDAAAAILATVPAIVDLAAVLPKEAPPAVGRAVTREELVGLGPVGKAYLAAGSLELMTVNVERDRDGDVVAFTCRCPCHRERTPSAGFRTGDRGQAWGKCHGADCEVTTGPMFAALGLEPQDIYPTRHYTLRKAALAAARSTGRTGPPRPGPSLDPAPPARRVVDDEQSERFEATCERAREALEGHPEKLTRLAERLGVSEGSLEELGVGWREDYEPAGDIFRRAGRFAWTFPEYDGHQRCVGYLRRYEDESLRKKRAYGGRPGLYLPDSWEAGPGPLLIVEGSSDAAAAWDLGWAAIGRADAESGLDDLRVLLAGEAREVLVVPDNDPHGAGRRGAERLARGLTEALGRTVRVMPLPERFKDVRAYKAAIDAGKEAGDGSA
jgi:TOTE conflict system, Archaeo-Eukaryotic Primase domain